MDQVRQWLWSGEAEKYGKNGEIFSIMVNDLKQIDPSEIDKCSEEINTFYSELIDMEVNNEN